MCCMSLTTKSVHVCVQVFWSHCAETLAEVDVLNHTVAQLEASVVDKERDIQRKAQAVREEEWQKLHKVESEKYVARNSRKFN